MVKSIYSDLATSFNELSIVTFYYSRCSKQYNNNLILDYYFYISISLKFQLTYLTVGNILSNFSMDWMVWNHAGKHV